MGIDELKTYCMRRLADACYCGLRPLDRSGAKIFEKVSGRLPGQNRRVPHPKTRAQSNFLQILYTDITFLSNGRAIELLCYTKKKNAGGLSGAGHNRIQRYHRHKAFRRGYRQTSTKSVEERSKFESTGQVHNVPRVDFSFQCLQWQQIVSIDIHEWCFMPYVVPVQRQRISDQSFRQSNSREVVDGLFYSRNERIVVVRVCPREIDEQGIGGVARLASTRGRKGRRNIRVG